MEIPEIPFNKDITYLGQASFRDKNVLFGIKRKDRRQHVYVLGKSGTGKSVLMFNMIIQNIQNGEGVCVVDPHGELVEGVLSAIPAHRMKDVIYFNPADTDYHIGFNVLELEDPKYKHLVASGLMGIFTKIWANAWSARMEYILNNCILALLDTPGTTLLGIPRMLVDKEYRRTILNNLKDPVIKAFWLHEYEAWQDKFRNEAIAPIQNKVGQFLSSSIIRNVVGQSKSTVNVFDIMNEGKIFLVNVSKGRIGEDNSSLLGGMIITKVQLAAMERVRIPEEERKDFYLYVDEFQNFVTDAFAGILSEARKYRLNLTIAHQYTAQLTTKESSAMRDAVFGNVGTMIVFRVGADDAEFLEKEFDPEFTQQDIVSLPNYKIYLKLMIDGITSRPFSAKTLPPLVKSGNKEIEDEVIKTSRELYCRTKEDVEKEINDWSGMTLGPVEDAPGVEKFPVTCSICKKETTVPFKPEPGRAVYCKDCVAKIKSGELQPIKVPNKDVTEVKPSIAPAKPNTFRDMDIRVNTSKPITPVSAPLPPKKVVVTADNIKKVFYSTPTPKPEARPEIKPKPIEEKPRENFALKDILNKTLNDNKVFETKAPERTAVPQDIKPAPQATISLDSLRPKREETPVMSIPQRDRSATPDNINALKDLLNKVQSEKSVPIEQAQVKPQPQAQTPTPTPVPSAPAKESPSLRDWQDKIHQKNNPVMQQKAPDEPAPQAPDPYTPPVHKTREIPEDVLMKILQ